MIAHLSKALHAGGEASKCTPTISILTPPLSSGLFSLSLLSCMLHGTRETHKPSSFPHHMSKSKCHHGDETKTRKQMVHL